MAKIAVDCATNDRPALGSLRWHLLARGNGWTVSNVACGGGPRDRSFEEQHTATCIALVAGGTFQYRSSSGRELMTPGSLLLGNAGEYFECGHEHAAGDRCISFSYEPECFEMLAAEAGASPKLRALRIPPVKELSTVSAQAVAYASITHLSEKGAWNEIAIELAGRVLQINSSHGRVGQAPLSAEARVTRVVRMIESCPGDEFTLATLATEARLSRYHFLRTFRQLTGLTPHQYLLRLRLRTVARRLLQERARILDIAMDSGFGDVSHFNDVFRKEFDVSPGEYRQLHGSSAREPNRTIVA